MVLGHLPLRYSEFLNLFVAKFCWVRSHLNRICLTKLCGVLGVRCSKVFSKAFLLSLDSSTPDPPKRNRDNSSLPHSQRIAKRSLAKICQELLGI